MVFNGTAATYGHGKAVVTATGMRTEMGRIAGLLIRVHVRDGAIGQPPLSSAVSRSSRTLFFTAPTMPSGSSGTVGSRAQPQERPVAIKPSNRRRPCRRGASRPRAFRPTPAYYPSPTSNYSAAGKSELAPGDVVALFQAGVDGIQQRGKAALGDKTMLDALLPAFKTQFTNVGAPRAICISPGTQQFLYSSNSNPTEDPFLDGEIYGRCRRPIRCAVRLASTANC